eukprot:10098180-Alexandrium_andersonii.AAC.1
MAPLNLRAMLTYSLLSRVIVTSFPGYAVEQLGQASQWMSMKSVRVGPLQGSRWKVYAREHTSTIHEPSASAQNAWAKHLLDDRIHGHACPRFLTFGR